MVTGQRLFTGETVSEVLASVIKDEPPWERLPEGCPPAVVRLLHGCLRKLPRQRLADIGDARLELDEALEGPAVGSESTSAAAARELERGRRRERWVWASALVVAVLAAAAMSLGHFAETREAGVPVRFPLDLPEGLLLDPLNLNLPAVSPDGRSIAFSLRSSTDAGRASLLFVRSLVSGETRTFPGTGRLLSLLVPG